MASFEEKLDGVIEALSPRSTQIFPPTKTSPTLEDCIKVVKSFPEFQEGSQMFAEALCVLMEKKSREAFMILVSDEAKMTFLKVHTRVEESVEIFLMTLAHGCTNRFVQEAFNRSRETIHRHFHKVLKAVLRMSTDIIKPLANYNENVPEHISSNRRYYPMFKNCIGAIDGTHIRATVPQKQAPKYIGRKGYATQNVMAACEF